MSWTLQRLVPFTRSDPWLWLAVAALGALSIVMVYSASLETTPHPRITGEAARHGVFAAMGVFAMLFAARMDYRLLRRLSPLLYVGVMLALLLVIASGTSEYGSRRWLGVGSLTVQPSEFAKLALVIAVAAYATRRAPSAAALLTSAALVVPMVLAVLLEPDMGTAIAMSLTWLVLLVAWGAHWRLLGTMLAIGLSAGPLLFAVAVPGYQRERLAVFFDPDRDPLGSGFNLRQAEAALSSGGLEGRGLFGGADSQLSGVAARSSDFILSLVGEELGLAGSMVVLALLALVVWRGFEAAQHAPDRFGRLLASGLTAMILTQALVNVAVNVRLFPATGIPLPFVSAGGSSLLVMFIAAGLLQSVASNRPATPQEQWRGERWR